MKIYIKRSMAGTVGVNPQAASFALSPVTTLKSLANRPLSSPLIPPVMADYVALGASGGINVASPQPGIKMARFGNWIPLKVNYFRNTLAYRIGNQNTTRGAFYQEADGSFRDVAGQDAQNATLAPGTIVIKGQSAPVGPPFNWASELARDIIFPSKLNVSPGSSQNVDYEAISAYNLGIWPNISSTNGFPSASNYLSNTPGIESAWSADSAWKLTTFIDDPVSTINPGNSYFAMNAAMCDYYEIEVDDSLVANISSLANEVFIVIPPTLGTTSARNVNGLVLDGYTGFNGQTAETTNEIVIPLSYALAQANTSNTIYRNTSGASIASAIKGGGGNYDMAWSMGVGLSFVAQPEITLLDPIAMAGTVGPY